MILAIFEKEDCCSDTALGVQSYLNGPLETPFYNFLYRKMILPSGEHRLVPQFINGILAFGWLTIYNPGYDIFMITQQLAYTKLDKKISMVIILKQFFTCFKLAILGVLYN